MSKTNADTRECIESALILLMQEKPFPQITIQEIIRRAGVGRSSYYRNYSSKENILESRLDFLILETADAMGKFDFSTKSVESWLAVLKIAKITQKNTGFFLRRDSATKFCGKS